MNITDVIVNYRRFLKRRNYSAHTVKNYMNILRHFVLWVNVHIEEVDRQKVAEYTDHLLYRRLKPKTVNCHLACIRVFYDYLYHEEGIIKRDLATLLVGPPMFAEPTPPKFLRPEEVKKLFASFSVLTSVDIRTYAMVHLAYTLGLRPVEITRITLDDISFQKGALTLPDRKADNPITLPVPENTLKAIAAYVLKARPKSFNRHVFLSCDSPHDPISSITVAFYLSKIMKKVGLPSTAYWLRHTYAQNLLEMGRSIYEIKEMLGHQSIQSSHRYIYIHTKLMRKVLFNETL